MEGLSAKLESRFQSTCPRGARLQKSAAFKRIHDFNPRAHEGHDKTKLTSSQRLKFQSTCPRGARRYLVFVNFCPVISIHVPTRGTTHGAYAHAIEFEFQSTCPRGARPYPATSDTVIFCDFNPRAHEGHDCRTILSRPFGDISIHVPTRGTTDCTAAAYENNYFNPRAHEGHDEQYRICVMMIDISIHVPTRGTTAAWKT